MDSRGTIFFHSVRILHALADNAINKSEAERIREEGARALIEK